MPQLYFIFSISYASGNLSRASDEFDVLVAVDEDLSETETNTSTSTSSSAKKKKHRSKDKEHVSFIYF